MDVSQQPTQGENMTEEHITFYF